MIQRVSSSGNVSSSGLPCHVDPGSPFRSWLHAYVKQRLRAISLPLQTLWTKRYIPASFAEQSCLRRRSTAQNLFRRLELDTAAGGNFISTRFWTELGKLKLQHAQWRCRSASKHPLPIIGVFTADAKYGDVSKSFPVSFLVSEIPVCICLVGMLLEPCGSPWN